MAVEPSSMGTLFSLQVHASGWTIIQLLESPRRKDHPWGLVPRMRGAED